MCATQMQAVDNIRYIASALTRHVKACQLETSKKLIPVGLLRHEYDVTILWDLSFN